MKYFDDLPYSGQTLKCRSCDLELFYTKFNRIRYKNVVKYVWGYQCQDCGKLELSEQGASSIDFLKIRCDCGGQFRRDRPLFCVQCKYNKTDSNSSDTDNPGEGDEPYFDGDVIIYPKGF
jgi:hypothetical protein